MHSEAKDFKTKLYFRIAPQQEKEASDNNRNKYWLR